MPALQPAPGVIRVVVEQSLGTTPVANVLHFRRSNTSQDPWEQDELDATCDVIRRAWVDNILPMQHSSLSLGAVVAQDLTSDMGLAGVAEGSDQGSITGTTLPANVAVCISVREQLRYRGGHGRMYLAAGDAGSVQDATTWGVDFRNFVRAAVEGWDAQIKATVAADGTHPVYGILHRVRNRQILPAPMFSPALGYYVDSRVDSQRRRLGKDRSA